MKLKLRNGYTDKRHVMGEQHRPGKGVRGAVLFGVKNYTGRCNAGSYGYRFGSQLDIDFRDSNPNVTDEPGWYCECGAPIDCDEDCCSRCGSDKPGEWR